jgi:hypothetical protein
VTNQDPRQPDRFEASPPSGPTNPTQWSAPNTLASQAVPVTGAIAGTREGFLTLSFVWMFLGLLLSAGTAVVVLNNPQVQDVVYNSLFLLLMAELGFVFVVSLAINRLGALPALALFFVYALLNGATLSIIALAYTEASITAAFLGASGVFGAAALYGVVTRRDLTSLGGLLFVGLIGLLVMMVVNIFIGGSTMSYIIGIIGVLLFTGLTAYDVQRIRNGKLSWIKNRESASVIGALQLYLDFINLFLMFLRITGGSRA